MKKNIYYEEYEIGNVRETIGRTITETDIILHAGQTGDFYPQHMDAEFCKKTQFGQRIAHGTLTFSIGVGMTAEFVNPVAFSYGYDHLRFVKPVFINDTIHVKVTVKEKRENPKHPERGFIIEGVQVINQLGETVLICDHILSCQKKSENESK